MILIETLEELTRQLRDSETSLLQLRSDNKLLNDRCERLEGELIELNDSMLRLRSDNRRINARCERLEGELIELRERLMYASDFECINPNEPVESA